MAIYHLNAKVISRGKGQSAIAAAAYRSGERLRDEAAGEQKFYTSREQRIQFTAIMAPKDAPDWAYDRNQLWNEAERAEKRKDSQLAREIEVALPSELTAQQREWLVKDFAREAFVRRGYAVDIAIHAPDDYSDQRNYHAHIMVTMRTLGPEGFAAKKDRDLNSKEQLAQWREDWARLANRHLERYGHAERIDHRSLTEQGIDREPTVHVGYAGSEIERRGGQSDRMDALKRILDRNGIRVDLKSMDLELKALEADQVRLLAMVDAQQKLQQAARADERALHTNVAKNYGQGARDAAGVIRQTRQDDAQVLRDEQRAKAFERVQASWRKKVDQQQPNEGTPKRTDSGLHVIDGATGAVSKLADFMTGLLAGSSEPAEKQPLDMKTFLENPAARREQQEAQLLAKRSATLDEQALDHIRQDMEAGRGLKADDIRNLTPAHQMQIAMKGDDAVRQMVQDAQRRKDDDYERER